MPTTRAQRFEALEKANEVRSHMAETKRALATREITLYDVVGDERLAGTRLMQFVMALPAIGEVKAAEAFKRAQVSTTRRLRDTNPRTVSKILAALGGQWEDDAWPV